MTVYGSFQTVVPPSLRQRILPLRHYHPIACPQSGRPKYTTLSHKFFWLQMLFDVSLTARHCSTCIRNGYWCSHWHPLYLFSPLSPLDFFAIDILCPISKRSNFYQWIAINTDKYSNLAQAVPLSKKFSAYTEIKFFDHYLRHSHYCL